MTDSALIPSPTAGEEVRSFIEQAALRARVQSEAEDRLRFERLVADLAARFVNIPPEKLDEAIVDSQRQIVGVLDLDRSALFQLVNGGDLVYTRSWTRPEYKVPPPRRLSVATDVPWFLTKLRTGETVALSTLDGIPAKADRENLKRFGAKATVVVPLVADGTLVGAVTFAAMRAERTWPMPVLDRLRLVGNVFAQALARLRSHEELQTAQGQWKVRTCVEREDRQEANRWRRVT